MRFARLDKDYYYSYLELDLATDAVEPEWVAVYVGTAQDLEVWMDAITGEITARELETPEGNE